MRHNQKSKVILKERTQNDHGPINWEHLRSEVVEGFLYTHHRLNANTSRTLEGAAFLYALIELLEKKGLISIDELDEQKKEVGKRLVAKYRKNGAGVKLQDPEYDKYEFNQETEIDCQNRVHVCKAICCKLPFALSKQDLYEGIVRWDLGQPYMIDHGDDGFCNHLDRNTAQCQIHQNRPVPCRAYDCRKDKRIWLDFKNTIPNPAIHRSDWPLCFTDHDPEKGLLKEEMV